MKNNTKEKNNNVGKYAAVAGAFLASGAVNAQIQYTDITPDEVVDLTNTPFAIDMDGDLAADVQFNVATIAGSLPSYGINYSGTYAAATGATGGGVLGVAGGSSTNALVSALSSGNTVDAAGGFISGGLMAMELSVTGAFSTVITSGNFVGATDMYVGVSFDSGGSTHYGWVRVDVAANGSSVTVKDYAYNSAAGGAIDAGQGVGLNDVALGDKVNFKTMLDEAVINVTPDLIGGEIVMIDMAGNQVKAIAINGVNTTINYNGVNTGVYMLVVNANGDSTSKKVYVR